MFHICVRSFAIAILLGDLPLSWTFQTYRNAIPSDKEQYTEHTTLINSRR